jgi:two-component sensor histidine kinase
MDSQAKLVSVGMSQDTDPLKAGRQAAGLAVGQLDRDRAVGWVLAFCGGRHDREVDFGAYVRSLTEQLLRSFDAERRRIKLNVNADGLFLGVNTAISLGLLLNELVTNALKHAFPQGRPGEIRIELERVGEDWLNIVVADDGVGFCADLDVLDSPSLGLRLVRTLVDQLAGLIEFQGHCGTTVRITLHIDDRDGRRHSDG